MDSINRRQFGKAAVAILATAALPAWGDHDETRAVRVLVNPKRRLGRLPPFGLGFSTEKNLIGLGNFYTPQNTEFSDLCTRLGPQVLRVGGTHVDHTRWNPKAPGGENGVVAPADIERFAAYIRSLGWKVVYGLNLAHMAPRDAAQEAQYAVRYLGDALLAFEIGNEPDLFVAHDDRAPGYNYATFLMEWREHAKAVREAVPHAPLSGPGAYGAWRMYGLPFAHDAGAEIQMLTQHYYRMSGKKPEATLDALLDGIPALCEEMAAMVQAAAASHIRYGFRMIETNSFVGGGLPGVSDRMVAGLWTIDYAMRAAEIGVNGLNFQIGPKGHSNSSIAMGPQAHVSEVRPEFYALAMIADMGHGSMLETTLTGAPRRVSAFCMESYNGERNVVLNNMTDNETLQVTVDAGSGATHADALLFTAAHLRAAECTLGGGTINTHGQGSMRWE